MEASTAKRGHMDPGGFELLVEGGDEDIGVDTEGDIVSAKGEAIYSEAEPVYEAVLGTFTCN